MPKIQKRSFKFVFIFQILWMRYGVTAQHDENANATTLVMHSQEDALLSIIAKLVDLIMNMGGYKIHNIDRFNLY